MPRDCAAGQGIAFLAKSAPRSALIGSKPGVVADFFASQAVTRRSGGACVLDRLSQPAPRPCWFTFRCRRSRALRAATMSGGLPRVFNRGSCLTPQGGTTARRRIRRRPWLRALSAAAHGRRGALTKARSILAGEAAKMGKAEAGRDLGHTLIAARSLKRIANPFKAGIAQITHRRGASKLSEVLEQCSPGDACGGSNVRNR